MTATMAPAGWYADPTDPTDAAMRYWDGAVWTDQFAARPASQPLPPPAAAPAQPSVSPTTR